MAQISSNQQNPESDGTRSVEEIAGEIIAFAVRHKLAIHPGQAPMPWAALVIKKGGCPCVPGRNHCPCDLALDDIKKMNRCRCGLFVNEAYIEEYNQLIGERKTKGKWKLKPGRSS